jgi:hypothetical protein
MKWRQTQMQNVECGMLSDPLCSSFSLLERLSGSHRFFVSDDASFFLDVRPGESVLAAASLSSGEPRRLLKCAVRKAQDSGGRVCEERKPTRQLSLQPVAVRAGVEATKRSKPLM